MGYGVACAGFDSVGSQCSDYVEMRASKGIEAMFGNTDTIHSGVSGMC